eukprot:TRINITY_DN22614_c0_g1_i1.p1 TRINITY_DN22614_c0_g1~~TRINITY_DN22614_c0_g1_i1.p1  ORF type:complete len:366 (+),score=56.33 TRINITY_DN22614_c0_g1_i1:44-1141(+)
MQGRCKAMGNGSVKNSLRQSTKEKHIGRDEPANIQSCEAAPIYGLKALQKLYDIGSTEHIQGAYGSVQKATFRTGFCQEHAVKIISQCNDSDEGSREADAMRAEATLLERLTHGSIIRYWGFYEDSDFLCFVMDLCKGGDVYSKLGSFTEEFAASMAIQMLSAIDYLHYNSIMHRKIKAESFLIQNDAPMPSLKLADFKYAQRFNKKESYTRVRGSIPYLAPELLQKSYNYQVDLWSFGVLIYLILYKRYPYQAHTTNELYREIVSKEPTWGQQGVSKHSVDFIQLFLQLKPKKRAECLEGLMHPFILSEADPMVQVPGAESEIDFLPAPPPETEVSEVRSQSSDGTCVGTFSLCQAEDDWKKSL